MCMFPGEATLEKLGMTLLLKTVLGLNQLDLATLLESIPRSEVDECDTQGRTALY